MTSKQAEQHARVREALRRRAHEINEEVRAILMPAYEALVEAAARMGADADRFPLVLAVGITDRRTITVEEALATLERECLPYPSGSYRRDRVIDQWVDEQMADHIPEGEDE